MRVTRRAPILLAAGVVLVAISGGQAVSTARFLAGAVQTSGEIVLTDAHPTVSFRTPDGHRMTFVQNGFVSGAIGTMLPVVYRAADPAGTATVARVWPLWGAALWLTPFGLGLLGAGLAGAVPVPRPGRF